MLQNQSKEVEHKLTKLDQSKGGLVRSDKKKVAAKWRAYKKLLKLGKIDSLNPKWLLERVENDKAFAVDMLKDIDKLELDNNYPKDKLVFLKNQIYKSLHGKAPQLSIQSLSYQFFDKHRL